MLPIRYNEPCKTNMTPIWCGLTRPSARKNCALQIAFFCVLYAYGRFAADAYSLLRKLGGVKAKERL